MQVPWHVAGPRIINHKAPAVAVDACKMAVADSSDTFRKSVVVGCNPVQLPALRVSVPSGAIWPRPLRLSELCGADITGFIQRHAYKRSPRSAQHLSVLYEPCCAIFDTGEILTDLAACVPQWRTAVFVIARFYSRASTTSTRSLQSAQRCGRRNYAILLLLARLGLRACEVVAMTLDDIDWKAGNLTVRARWTACSNALLAELGRAIPPTSRKDGTLCKSTSIHSGARTAVGFANSAAVSTLVQRALADAGVDSPHTVLMYSDTRWHSDAQAWSFAGGDRTVVASCTSGHNPDLCEGRCLRLTSVALRWPEVRNDNAQTSSPGLHTDAPAPRLQDAA